MRAGIGYDVHKLVGGKKLIIGGANIPYEKGLLGHSDADVLIHAVCDSILGAAAMGDIGEHFPDNSAEFKDIDSKVLLYQVNEMIKKKQFSIVNIDSTIFAQKPKLSPYKADMAKNIAAALKIPRETVNVKATTTEGLGFIGRQEGIAAMSIAMLRI